MKEKVVWDGTDADMERLKGERPGLFLIEVQNHKDEKALVFGVLGDIVPPVPPPVSLEARVASLEADVAVLKKKP